MTTSSERFWPDALAAAGAAALLVSLWLSWYTFRLPQYLVNELGAMSGQLGALGGLLHNEAQLIHDAGPLHVDAWQVFKTTDVVLTVIAVLGAALALLSLTGRAEGAGRIVALGAVIAAGLCLYRTLSPPGPDTVLHPATGAYLGLGASLMMLLGGLLSHRTAEPLPASAVAWTPAPPAWQTATPPPSVPPPAA